MMHFIQYFSLASALMVFGAAALADVIPVYQVNQADATYLQTTLTHDIYRYAADSQLNDLVVTDQQGNKLPYRLVSPEVKKTEQTQLTEVRYFPVPVGAAPETLLVLSSASIRLDDNEISVSAVKDHNETQDQSVATDFYVVDLSEVRSRVDRLRLLWPVNERHQYLEVQVNGTNDMTNWSAITKTTLVQLQKDGEQLTRNTIQLNLTEMQYAYLQLKFTRGGDDLRLTQVHIENTDKLTSAPELDKWQLAGALAEKQDSAIYAINSGKKIPVAAWEFERDDIAPVTRISIDLGTLMYGDNIKLFSRHTKKQPWNLVHQGIWFNAQVGETWQHSNPINIYANSDTQWRLELSEQVRSSANPQLEFIRQPELLQFIANKTAPFNIAINTKAIPGNQQTSKQIFSQLTDKQEINWQQTQFTELAPDLSGFARHSMNISWKTILFWGVLIGAVLVLVSIAARLLGQMKKTDEKS